MAWPILIPHSVHRMSAAITVSCTNCDRLVVNHTSGWLFFELEFDRPFSQTFREKHEHSVEKNTSTRSNPSSRTAGNGEKLNGTVSVSSQTSFHTFCQCRESMARWLHPRLFSGVAEFSVTTAVSLRRSSSSRQKC
jgi:hypothetical protein